MLAKHWFDQLMDKWTWDLGRIAMGALLIALLVGVTAAGMLGFRWVQSRLWR